MLDKTEFLNCKEILLNQIQAQQADALVIDSFQNRLWLLNFESSAGYVCVQKDGLVTFFIDGRYFAKAHALLSEEIEVINFKNLEQIETFLKEHKVKKVLLENSYTNVQLYLNFKKMVEEVGLFNDQVIRIQKSAAEITSLIKAANIAVETTEFIKLYAKPGMSEKHVAQVATIKMLELGGSKNSFDPIVASGPNGANPHHHPSDRLLEAHEMLTLDLGCVYNNYCSDMTRTWAVANTQLPKEIQSLHEAVYQSQLLGLEACVVGKTNYDVDFACRNYLKEHDLNQYFVHSTGHGLGIDVHELPSVSANKKLETKLLNQMVITIEPGVYIPNKAGLRIEDSVIINDQKPIILNAGASKKSNW